MPILAATYDPPVWARPAHVNTIWAAKFRRVRYPDAAQAARICRVRLDTPDGDFLDVDVHPPLAGSLAPGAAERGVVVISHGLEGHSRRRYVLGLTEKHRDNFGGQNAITWDLCFAVLGNFVVSLTNTQ